MLIHLDTSSLPSGLFYLDLQLAGTDNVPGKNTVSVNQLNLGGGVLSSADLTNVTGTFPNYSMNDTNYFNQALIGFTRGSSVSFQLSYTNTFSGNGAPDTFSAALLDASFNSIVGSGLGVLLQVNLDGSGIQTYAADAAFGSIRATVDVTEPSGNPVPEPGTLVLMAAGFAGLCISKTRWGGSR